MLLLPLLMMEITDQVNWDVADLAIFGAMLVGAGGIYELAARVTNNISYSAAVGVALAAAFILVWMNLAVGITGSEDYPANLMYGSVLAVGIIGVVSGIGLAVSECSAGATAVSTAQYVTRDVCFP